MRNVYFYKHYLNTIAATTTIITNVIMKVGFMNILKEKYCKEFSQVPKCVNIFFIQIRAKNVYCTVVHPKLFHSYLMYIL